MKRKEIPDEAIADRSLTGHLIDMRHFHDNDTNNNAKLRLVACPLADCEYKIEHWHRPRTSISDHLLNDHNPEDFGLNPPINNP